VNNEITPLISKVEYLPKTNSKSTKAYLTVSEKNEIQNTCGDTAYILFDYLLDTVKFRNPDTSIEGLVKITKWTKSKVGRAHKKLVDAGLLYKVYLGSSKGSKLVITYLGSDLVKVAKQADDSQSLQVQINVKVKELNISKHEAHMVLMKECALEGDMFHE